jgi:bifunctional non-homologous end joining protein LigD
VARLARSHPVVLYVFDLLYLEGHDLRAVPLRERKMLLKEVVKTDDRVRYSEHFTGDGAEILSAVEKQGLEGIVAKRAQSKYEARRNGDWVKWKVSNSGEFVICGFTAGERGAKSALKKSTATEDEATFGALVLGVYEDGKLRWAGNVGTGFDEKMIRTLHAKLLAIETPRSPLPASRDLPKKVTWTKPELACAVKFSNWTEDGRLRAPVFLGLREDIDPKDCTVPGADEKPASKLKSSAKKNEKSVSDSSASEGAKLAVVPPKKKLSKEDTALLKSVLLDPNAKEAILDIDGHPLKFTHLDKIFYPKDGYVKRDLLNYYNAVAPLLAPHLKDRPLSLKRYPNGIEQPYFFQKQIAESFPKWLHTADADGITWVIGDDRATILYLVNLGCIDHNPWMSRVGSLDHPDYVLIDLDPYECSYEKIVEAALWVRGRLERLELESYPKTTGGDGLHIFIPLEPRYTYEQARQFAEALAVLGAAERPDLFTTPRAVVRREKGKVYFDWHQIAHGKTISAPYVLRAYAGAPVAAPLDWSEVTPRLRPEQFHLGNALARFERVGDLFNGVLTRKQTLDAAVGRLAAH